MLKIGQIINIKIEKIVFGGEGLAYYNNMAIFVPMSAIGDEVEAKIISTKKTYARALITKIIVPSDDRENIEKISFKDNSGCDFAHIKYDKQIEYKNTMLKDMLNSISKVDISDIYEGIEKANNIKYYRNKVAMPFFKQNSIIKTGFYERKSHDIFEVKDDILQSKISSKINDIICKKLNEEKFKVYNEKTNEGFLKHLIIRNNSKNEVLVAIVVNKKSSINKLKKLLIEICEQNTEIVSAYISVKNRQDNVILGDENIHVFGKEYIKESIFDINFKIYLDSFFQINKEQVIKLYSKALFYIDKTSNVIDAYSGTGTIAMLLSKKANKVFAIESVKSASISAKNTAYDNNIKNIEFINNKVEKSIEKILKNNKIEQIIFDPPRKGLELEIIEEVCKNNIEKIVYISCEPSKFARDLNYFQERSYKLTKISAVDMFPNTHHIEVVALIEKI